MSAGWSFFRHNLTEERVEDLPPGKGAAAAMLLTANASRAANATWTQRVRRLNVECRLNARRAHSVLRDISKAC